MLPKPALGRTKRPGQTRLRMQTSPSKGNIIVAGESYFVVCQVGEIRRPSGAGCSPLEAYSGGTHGGNGSQSRKSWAAILLCRTLQSSNLSYIQLHGEYGNALSRALLAE